MLRLTSVNCIVGPIVLKECGPPLERRLREYMAAGTLREVLAGEVPLGPFTAMLERYRLGDGETECLTVALTIECLVATDDRAARRAVIQEFGESRLTGSLGLLRIGVRESLITSSDAMNFYQAMRRLGAFLPEIELSFFDDA